MAAHRSALSYAVGEWARVLAAQDAGALARRLLRAARLGQPPPTARCSPATCRRRPPAAWCRRSIPEGGLSRDGRLRKPKLGLINYMVSSFDPEGSRDLVFVPVGINYDRVLEDRMLVRAPGPGEPRPSRARVLANRGGLRRPQRGPHDPAALVPLRLRPA